MSAFLRRDIFLKIERLDAYSPLAPILCARHYGRDCMFGPGHELGRLSNEEIMGATVDALVFREYLDPHYTIPNTACTSMCSTATATAIAFTCTGWTTGATPTAPGP
jgi:hypothetical protein